MSDIRDDVREAYNQLYGHAPMGLWSAPGHIELLGGHPEATDGFALACAIDRRTVIALGLREDRRLRVASTWADEVVEIELVDLAPGALGDWSAHPLGVAWALGANGADLAGVPGADILIDSDVPVGAGLGSSAALEAAVALALSDAWHLKLDPSALARTCRLARKDTVGAPLGMAGPTAALSGSADSAVLIDRNTFEAQAVPLDLAGAGLELLVVDIGGDRMPDAPAVGSGRPATTKNGRVLEAARLLREQDPIALGALLDAEHASLRGEPGPASAEAELVVDVVRANGAIGARSTHRNSVLVLSPVGTTSLLRVAIDGAFAEHGYGQPDTFIVTPGDGAVRDA